MADNLKALSVSGENNRASYQTSSPNPEVLERFRNPRKNPKGLSPDGLVIEIDCPEFTSVCPVTGQPDFGNIRIDYTPNKWCVESKALKLYLMGFRNHGAFHESCVHTIGTDLVRLLKPLRLRVRGTFMPRGGISINPTFEYFAPPPRPTSL